MRLAQGNKATEHRLPLVCQDITVSENKELKFNLESGFKFCHREIHLYLCYVLVRAETRRSKHFLHRLKHNPLYRAARMELCTGC